MNDKILKIINEIIEEKGNPTVDEISDTTSLKDDLEFDSFDLALLTAKVEDKFDVDIFEDGIVRTVGEVLAKLEKKQ